MSTLAVDFTALRALTAEGLTVSGTLDGHPVELLLKGVKLDHLADFAAAEHMR